MGYDPENPTNEIPVDLLTEVDLDRIQARVDAGESVEEAAGDLVIDTGELGGALRRRRVVKARRGEMQARKEAARARRQERREERQQPGQGRPNRPNRPNRPGRGNRRNK